MRTQKRKATPDRMRAKAVRLRATRLELLDRNNMTAVLDAGLAAIPAIGVIVLATERTLEQEWRLVFRMNDVAYYQSRIMSPRHISVESLAAMRGSIAEAAELIHPGEHLDVLAYACTSGAMVIGEDTVSELMRQAHPEAQCTTPITAALAGLRTLGAGRIALLTPYVDSVNAMMRRYIEERGIRVPLVGSFTRPDDSEVARISPKSIEAAILDLGRAPMIDAVFVSCTTLRVAGIVEAAERQLGKPVISSNLALAWHSLRLAGYRRPVPGFGELLRR